MGCLIEDLRNSDVCRWYTSTAEARADEQDHGRLAGNWATRLRYYQAFISCLPAPDRSAPDPSAPDQDLRGAVMSAAGAQSSSTLYTLTGPKSRTAMLSRVDGTLTAGLAAGRGVVARLAAEVKVWSHWPYRAGWLAELGESEPHGKQLAAATLVRVLAVWAHDNQALAASCQNDPPMSAAEDLVIIAAGLASPARARDLLAKVIELGRGELGAQPREVFEAVSGDLMALGLAGHRSGRSPIGWLRR